ncbi:DUF3267 domain-containing protein [Amphibacillus cookii]|uniref:DUF3267 domain-containing protein n=1 Tax=Amphibacillus cookii TaxID=767787 RepID=UPI001957D818|nr:DUF3267 domain-containing protein [Amphibacillus cookii]MBM7541271.1 sterol desaturase/sphingolipid hydroxylase (fatty acid hydroxylase superfamily) [Amphibacillus cookii]
MNLVWKGIYKSSDQLPVGDLPEHAVKFKEPNTMVMMNIVASLFIIPVIMLVLLAIIIKTMLWGISLELVYINIWGILLAFLTLLPHEFLHAILFPKDKEVELWVSPKAFMAFVVSTAPISKRRFIFLSLLPNIVFGLIPLIIWIFIPEGLAITAIFFTFASVNLLFGVGDYLNVFNAIVQMPKGSMQQLSGMNSYWYLPKK